MPLGLTVTAAARALGVTRKALSELINGHSGISPEMAIRLTEFYGGKPKDLYDLMLKEYEVSLKARFKKPKRA